MPGETPENYNELLNFVKEARFEKVGVFVYSREEGTPAFDMPDQVPEIVKKERMNKLMEIQRTISGSVQQKMIGKTLKVLVEEQQKGEENVYLGRSEYDAPEVDGMVFVHSDKELRPGDFVEVHITDALEYDLVGEVV
jgi:ribosomal protein S12 methylthiotransferase